MEEILLKYMADFTSLSENEKREIYESLQIDEYIKGKYLLKQGEFSANKCYFVLMGCVRQFYIDELGKEVTSNFFTEEQAIPINNEQTQGDVSKYSLVCVEDCILVVGDVGSEKTMFTKYPQLETMIRKMMEINLGEIQEQFGEFINSSPEERYESILRKRPQLVDRVPQHQLASYLGVTPESLSRIKKRMLK
ncbi:Crp/Fnr family transcriptional regulator [Metabacillus halosaccharovorans]|uniref:Crp/Fnr family transcriptional regulator n=1 Tax=Metabacillus halosaccharovorans TaxID=930124 RepID=A0ABT3DG70_9BACI|nr:Crp/Fnr family transcriptional regulator [Metabacillus halosaccharovorans]MCV9886042.1 Crp/Fnr family transcriptional regulator [Metabacillus halosaccharovorans]